MYYLLAYPRDFERLQREIDESFPLENEEVEMCKLGSMKSLNGIIRISFFLTCHHIYAQIHDMFQETKLFDSYLRYQQQFNALLPSEEVRA